jgi:hypothetical protein
VRNRERATRSRALAVEAVHISGCFEAMHARTTAGAVTTTTTRGVYENWHPDHAVYLQLVLGGVGRATRRSSDTLPNNVGRAVQSLGG